MLGWILKVAALAVLVAVLLYLRSYYAFLRRPQKPDEKVLPARRREAQADQALEAAPKKALLLYQDSRHGTLGRMAQIVAEDMCANGYEVTMNHPSAKLQYDPMDYDLLALGSPSYLGAASKLLVDFIKENPFTHKMVFVFVTGLTPEDKREILQLRETIPKHNRFVGIKFHKRDENRLREFLEEGKIYQ